MRQMPGYALAELSIFGHPVHLMQALLILFIAAELSDLSPDGVNLDKPSCGGKDLIWGFPTFKILNHVQDQ